MGNREGERSKAGGRVVVRGRRAKPAPVGPLCYSMSIQYLCSKGTPTSFTRDQPRRIWHEKPQFCGYCFGIDFGAGEGVKDGFRAEEGGAAGGWVVPLLVLGDAAGA